MQVIMCLKWQENPQFLTPALGWAWPVHGPSPRFSPFQASLSFSSLSPAPQPAAPSLGPYFKKGACLGDSKRVPQHLPCQKGITAVLCVLLFPLISPSLVGQQSQLYFHFCWRAVPQPRPSEPGLLSIVPEFSLPG